MVGQKQLQYDIEQQIGKNTLARFNILCGPAGSGKKTFCKEVFKDAIFVPDVKVDTLRTIISDAYSMKERTTYIIPDADNMSLQAKNSLLKVTEEPPNNVYFIMTLEDINNTLPTIKSRATVFRMNTYTLQEIMEYAHSLNFKSEEYDIVTELCESPGEVKYLYDIGVTDFYEYVSKVIANIAVVSPSNSFKIADKICLKENSTGYDLRMFLKAFKVLNWKCYLATNDIKHIEALILTEQTIQKCRNKSINKQMLIDTWILDIREAWL